MKPEVPGDIGGIDPQSWTLNERKSVLFYKLHPPTWGMFLKQLQEEKNREIDVFLVLKVVDLIS